MSGARLRSGDAAREIRVEGDAAIIDGRRVDFERRLAEGRVEGISIGGREHRIVAARDGRRVFVWCDGTAWTFERVAATRTAGMRDHGQDLISPMPGRVRRTMVADGESVARGQVLLVLEAMKMEHSIRSPADGTVRLKVREGDRVEAGVELAQIE